MAPGNCQATAGQPLDWLLGLSVAALVGSPESGRLRRGQLAGHLHPLAEPQAPPATPSPGAYKSVGAILLTKPATRIFEKRHPSRPRALTAPTGYAVIGSPLAGIPSTGPFWRSSNPWGKTVQAQQIPCQLVDLPRGRRLLSKQVG